MFCFRYGSNTSIVMKSSINMKLSKYEKKMMPITKIMKV